MLEPTSHILGESSTRKKIWYIYIYIYFYIYIYVHYIYIDSMYNLNDARRMPENVGTGVDNQIHSLQWRHHYVATRSLYQQNRGMSIIPYATPTSKLKDHVTSTFLCWVCFRFKAMAWRHGFAIQTIPGGELARPLFQAQLQGGSKPLWLPNVYM